MISRLAKDTISKWQNTEGLNPTFDDIIKLNNLGLKVEVGTEAFDFANTPRIAFLGDWILKEPTIKKQIWIDKTKSLLRDDLQTQLYFLAYALFITDEEIEEIKNIKSLLEKIKKFALDILIGYTQTQILMAISYCLTGTEDKEEYTQEQKEALKEVSEIPETVKSSAQQLLAEALYKHLPKEVENFTLDHLEKMIICAAINEGKDVLKNEHIKAAGKFYVEAGRIHERLKGEKKDK